MTDKHTEIIEKLCDRLRNQENVIGLVLFGSLAKGTSHKYSDIDLFVIGYNEIHRTECFSQEGIQVQIIWRSPTLFTDKISIRTRTYPICNSCKILYDQTGEIHEAIDKAKEQFKLGPIKLSDQEKTLKHTDLSIEHKSIKGLIEKGELASAIHMINEQVMLGINLFYDANDYYLVSPKHLISDIKTKNSDIGNLAENVILESSIDEKMNKFEIFRNDVLRILGGEIHNYELFW